MEDIDKNADGFIDLEEYIGKSVSRCFRRSWKALEDTFTHKNCLPLGSILSTSLSQPSVKHL